MTPHVKDFIESNIDLIQNKNYKEAFTIWYLHYSDTTKDSDYLQELFSIFQHIDIDMYNESLPARKEIISHYMYDYLDDVLANDPDVDEISLSTVIKHLNSKLDVRLIDLNELFKDVSNRLQNKHDIVRIPFKIKRRV